MRHTTLLVPFTLILLLAPAQGRCETTELPLQTITLTDGTSIKGRIVEMVNGHYVVATETLGRVTLAADKVSQITNANASAPATQPAAESQNQLSAMASQFLPKLDATHLNLMNDPQIMGLVKGMLSDPQVAEILKDPSLLRDAMTMDPAKIQSNHGVQKLMQHPQMQEMLRVTAQKLQTSGSAQ